MFGVNYFWCVFLEKVICNENFIVRELFLIFFELRLRFFLWFYLMKVVLLYVIKFMESCLLYVCILILENYKVKRKMFVVFYYI